MEKQCNVCKYDGFYVYDYPCNNCCRFTHNKYEAKMERIQMTEEQAREMLSVACNKDSAVVFDYAINRLKQAGYIIKNPVEEAEEMYQKEGTFYGIHVNKAVEIIHKQHSAIIYLQEEINKLRG